MRTCILLIIATLILGTGLIFCQEESKDFSIKGEINFVEYYSLGGKKCAAFLEGEDRVLYCILDNSSALRLKGLINKKTANVKLTGTLVAEPKEKLIDMKDYEVLQ